MRISPPMVINTGLCHCTLDSSLPIERRVGEPIAAMVVCVCSYSFFLYPSCMFLCYFGDSRFMSSIRLRWVSLIFPRTFNFHFQLSHQSQRVPIEFIGNRLGVGVPHKYIRAAKWKAKAMIPKGISKGCDLVIQVSGGECR